MKMKKKCRKRKRGKKSVAFTKEIIQTSDREVHMEDFSNRISSLYDDLNSRLQILKKEEGKINREICDINHYIELGNLDAYRGYNAYVMLRERFLKRRKIKDEIEYIRVLIEDNLDSKSKGYFKTLSKRKYTPREIKELFK